MGIKLSLRGYNKDKEEEKQESTNPYIPENLYDTNKYTPSNRSFVKNLIDDIIRLHKPTSGYIIQLLFDEYQRNMVESDKYTNFYSTYCMASNRELNTYKLSNNNLYVLLFNRFGDIYPKRVIKEYSLIAPIIDNTSIEENPKDNYAKQLAIFIHGHAKNSPDKWDMEIDEEGNHLWDKPIHQRYLIAANDAISYIEELTKEVN